MKTHRQGFTLVELLVVTVLGSILVAAAYQTLIVQERSFRTTGEIIRGQDVMRTAMGVLEAELREVATDPSTIVVGGSPMPVAGTSDVLAALPDSIVVRAQRRLGFVCSVGTSDKHAMVWSLSDLDLFEAEDALLIFADGSITTAADDHWVAARVNGNPQTSTASCPARPGSPVAHQRINLKKLDGGDMPGSVLANVLPGAPIRAVERVTYGLYPSPGGWYLGRRRGEGSEVQRLVDGLAGPGQGIVFTYLDAAGNVLADPVNPTSVRAVRVSARTAPPPGSRARPQTLTSQIHFRNN